MDVFCHRCSKLAERVIIEPPLEYDFDYAANQWKPRPGAEFITVICHGEHWTGTVAEFEMANATKIAGNL